MHEFTSISVSSYDAASLADKLTEKSAAGWDVVAIVPAGTNITAYLSREAEAAEPAPSSDTGSQDTASDDAAAVSVGDESGLITAPTAETEEIDEPAPMWEPEPTPADEEPAPVEEPAGWAVAPEPVSPAPASAGVAEVSAEPAPYVDRSSDHVATQPAEAAESGYVGEPHLGSTTAGYDTGTSTEPATGYDTGASTEPATGHDTGTSTDTGSDAGATTGATSGYDTDAATTAGDDADTATTAGYDTSTTADTATTGGADTGTATTGGADTATTAGSESAAASTSEQTAAAAASAAPAGWYADPSGRYELRYWDGNQWTEHVSRAGQQYTDPPVA